MNDRDLQQRVREAFDALEAPAAAKQRTLEAFDRLAAEAASPQQTAPVADASAAHPSAKPPIKVHRFRRARRHGVIGALAACLVLGAVLFGVTRAGAEPTAFVDIDINPSIELQVNRFDKVVAAEAVNTDGEAVLAQLDLAGLPYDEALALLTNSDALAPYLEENSYIQVSVAANDQGQEQALTTASEECLANLPYRASCHAVSLQTHEEAHAHGMGCGRYTAAVELASLDPEVTVEDCADLSMRELRERIDAHHSTGDAATTESPSGNGQGAGQGTGQGAGHGAGHRGCHHAQ